jgi:hypothetical protein
MSLCLSALTSFELTEKFPQLCSNNMPMTYFEKVLTTLIGSLVFVTNILNLLAKFGVECGAFQSVYVRSHPYVFILAF